VHKTSDNVKIVKNTLTISTFNVLGLVSGVGADMILAARFGLSREMDALFIALTLPQLLFAILFSAGNAVLVPAFAHARAARGRESAWGLFNATVTLALLLFALLSALGVLASPCILSAIAPGLAVPTRALAIRLSRIVFWMILPAGVIQVMGAMLNSEQRFAAPAALNFVQYSVIIACAWLGVPRWGITTVAVGYVVAAGLQLLMLGFSLWRIGGRYHPTLNLQDAELRTIGRLLWPTLVQGGISQGNVLFERAFASFLPPGSITALGYARRVLRAVSDIFLDSVSTAALPRLSALSAASDKPGIEDAIAFSVKLSVFLPLPVVTLLTFLNVPLIRVAFQRGAFDASATQITAGLMALYVLGVLPAAAAQMVILAFYAMRDTLTPLYLRVLTLAVNLVFDAALIRVLGPYGLALSLLLARLVGLVASYWALDRKMDVSGLELKSFFLRVGLAAMSVAAVALGARWLLEGLPMPRLQQLIALLLACGLGLLAYGVVAFMAGIEEVGWVVTGMKRWLVAHRAKPSQTP